MPPWAIGPDRQCSPGGCWRGDSAMTTAGISHLRRADRNGRLLSKPTIGAIVSVVFRDRTDAGRRLAARLTDLRGEDVVVLGLPRGGVPVAAEVAAALGAPLDVIVVRKLGIPFQPEVAMGAIGEEGARVLDLDLISRLRVSPAQIQAVERRSAAPRGARRALPCRTRARGPDRAHRGCDRRRHRHGRDGLGRVPGGTRPARSASSSPRRLADRTPCGVFREPTRSSASCSRRASRRSARTIGTSARRPRTRWSICSKQLGAAWRVHRHDEPGEVGVHGGHPQHRPSAGASTGGCAVWPIST